jgi:hypothetical protein
MNADFSSTLQERDEDDENCNTDNNAATSNVQNMLRNIIQEEHKKLIDEIKALRKDTADRFQSMEQEHSEQTRQLLSRNDALSTENKLILDELKTLKADIVKLSSKNNEMDTIGTSASSVQGSRNPLVNVVGDVMRENEEIEKKKLNLVLFNVPENISGSIEERGVKEKEKLKKIQEAIQTEITITELWRIGTTSGGRPRPLIIKCGDHGDKITILRSAKKLAHLPKDSEFSAVSIQPDRTKLQQEENRRLVTELKRRCGDGKNVVLRGGTILTKQP